MHGVTGVLLGLGVRFVVFGLVLVIAAKKSPKVLIHNRWATPLIALVFATLNIGLYWALTPILNLATMGALGFVMPLVANLIFLAITVRIFESKRWFEIQGLLTQVYLAVALTVAHGLCWLGLDYLPTKL
jgi:hypothetical protein